MTVVINRIPHRKLGAALTNEPDYRRFLQQRQIDERTEVSS